MTFPMVSRPRRAVPLALVVLAAVAAALLTVTTSSESAHASSAGHEHGNSCSCHYARPPRCRSMIRCESYGKIASRGHAWLS